MTRAHLVPPRRLSFSAQLAPDLGHPIDGVVLLVHPPDVFAQEGVGESAWTQGPGFCGVISSSELRG